MITAAGRGKCVLHCFLLLKHSWNEKWFDLNLRVTTTSLLRQACVPLTHVTMGMSRRVTQNVCVCHTGHHNSADLLPSARTVSVLRS